MWGYTVGLLIVVAENIWKEGPSFMIDGKKKKIEPCLKCVGEIAYLKCEQYMALHFPEKNYNSRVITEIMEPLMAFITFLSDPVRDFASMISCGCPCVMAYLLEYSRSVWANSLVWCKTTELGRTLTEFYYIFLTYRERSNS